MSNQLNQVASIDHRRNQETGGPPNKRQRSVQVVDQPTELKTIKDMNDDCLEHIFKKLDLTDLLNVAHSTKQLLRAACLAFASKYGKKTVRLLNGRIQTSIGIHNEVILANLPTGLRIMRCFGSSIHKLTTDYAHLSEAQLHEIDRYLNEYCAESLTELEYGRSTLMHLTKPFTKLTKLILMAEKFRCENADINKCFPNLSELNMCGYAGDRCLTAHFPNLVKLELVAEDDKLLKSLLTFLPLNPQLRIFTVSGLNFGTKFLEAISKCPQLESLSISCNITPLFKSTSRSNDIDFNAVKKLTINRLYLEKLVMPNPITFDLLEEFTLNNTLNRHAIIFITKHPCISKLVCSIDTMHKRLPLELAKALPSVVEVQIGTYRFKADEVIQFLNECKLLKKFAFQIVNGAEYEVLLVHLGNVWRASTNIYRNVTIER